jgi:hypothetical protein
MVSKCANPECSEMFRYLGQGKIFRLTPSPDVQAAAPALESLLTERFWLCDRCSQEMTIIWDGARAKIVPLPKRVEKLAILPPQVPHKGPQSQGHWQPRGGPQPPAAMTTEIEAAKEALCPSQN